MILIIKERVVVFLKEARENSKRIAEAKSLASKLNRHLEKEKRQYKLSRFLKEFLKKRVVLLLKEGKSLKDAEQILNEYNRICVHRTITA